MRVDKQKELTAAFPALLSSPLGYRRGDGEWFPIQCGDGWFEIVRATLVKLKAVGSPDLRVMQIKEKYGELRVYLSESDDDVDEATEAALTLSKVTCEDCGKPGFLRTQRRWLRTQCDACWSRGDHG